MQLAPCLVYEHGNDILGYAYGSKHHERAAYRWSANVSIYVEIHPHRQGIGRKLYAALLECLKIQGFYNAYVGISLPNPASIRLHESFHFKPVGVYHSTGFKLGTWHDVGWWECALQNRPQKPDEPRLLAEVLERPEWNQALLKSLWTQSEKP